MNEIEVLVDSDDRFKNLLCPRCGKLYDLKRGSLSRYVDVHICSDCGTEEAINDMIGVAFDKNSWYILRKG